MPLHEGYTALFPLAWIKQCIATYTKNHGKAPKLLVLSSTDYLDYKLNLSLETAVQLDIQVTHADYLKQGEIDLAMEIKSQKTVMKKK
jgi:hypothetical protein